MKKILLILLICLATIVNGAPNPFREVDTMDKAFEMTGFTLETPATCKNYKKKKINVIKDKMIEVVYLKESNTEGLFIRKSKGTYKTNKDIKNYLFPISFLNFNFYLILKINSAISSTFNSVPLGFIT